MNPDSLVVGTFETELYKAFMTNDKFVVLGHNLSCELSGIVFDEATGTSLGTFVADANTATGTSFSTPVYFGDAQAVIIEVTSAPFNLLKPRTRIRVAGHYVAPEAPYVPLEYLLLTPMTC